MREAINVSAKLDVDFDYYKSLSTSWVELRLANAACGLIKCSRRACPIESLPKLMSKGSFASERPRTAKRSAALRAPGIRLGERICVIYGAFEGVEGTLCAVKEGRRYVLALDGLPRGVFIAVEEGAIVPVPE